MYILLNTILIISIKISTSLIEKCCPPATYLIVYYKYYYIVALEANSQQEGMGWLWYGRDGEEKNTNRLEWGIMELK